MATNPSDYQSPSPLWEKPNYPMASQQPSSSSRDFGQYDDPMWWILLHLCSSSSRATLLVNHILDSFVIPSKAHLTRETCHRCRHHHPCLPLSLIFYDLSCITALYNSYSFDVLHWIRKRRNNENVAALITCKCLKGKALNDRYAHYTISALISRSHDALIMNVQKDRPLLKCPVLTLSSVSCHPLLPKWISMTFWYNKHGLRICFRAAALKTAWVILH